jgi:hypothetical protein
MSMNTTRIHCTGCDYEYFEHYRHIIIRCQFETGVVTYSRTNVWCYRCDKITYAEHIPTIGEIRDWYEKIYGEPGPPVTGLKKLLRRFDKRHNEGLQSLQLKLAWRETRTAPPHCLKCGSTNLASLDFIEASEHSVITESFRHSCGGALIHDYQDKTGFRYFLPTTEIWMDIEGNKISEGVLRRELRWK